MWWKKIRQILILTVELLGLFSFFSSEVYAQVTLEGGESFVCSCTYKFSLLDENGKKNCTSTTECAYGDFVVCDATAGCSSSGVPHRYVVENGNSFGFSAFVEAVENSLGNEKNPLVWKDDHFEDKGQKNKKFYLWPASVLDSTKFFDAGKVADWTINYDAFKSGSGEVEIPQKGCYSPAVIKEIFDNNKPPYISIPGYGSEGEVVPFTMICKVNKYDPAEDEEGDGGGTGADGSSSGGGDKLGISRLNKLGRLPLSTLMGNLIKGALSILGTVALIMFMYGGFVYMTSGGSAEDTKKAWNILVWGALGVIIILASYSLGVLIFNALV